MQSPRQAVQEYTGTPAGSRIEPGDDTVGKAKSTQAMAMATAVPMVDPGTGVQLVQLPPQATHQQPVLLPAPGMQPQPLQVVQLRPGNAEVTQVAQVAKSVPI